jgi:uroporphyrinogen decarboxylase
MESLNTKFFRGILGESGSTIPSFPIIFGYSIWAYHKHTGIPAYEIMKDGSKHASAQLYVAKEYDLPFVVAYTDLNIVGEALGATLTYMNDVIPVLEVPAIENSDLIEWLEPANPQKDGRMPEILKTCEIFVKKFKDPEHILNAGVEGPITAAASIWGMENLMRNMIKNPDLVHKILEVATDSIIDFLNAQMEYGMNMVSIAEPSASCTCISPKFFQEFAYPYLKRIARKVNTISFMIHICGESQNIIKTLTKIPKIGTISVDIVNLRKAKEIIGRKFISLMGNVPTEVMRYGTPQQVEYEANKCIREAAEGGQFMLSTACDLSPGTPPENIRALINAGKKYGTFPINH